MNMPVKGTTAYAAADFGFIEQVIVDATQDTVYELISEVANIGRWSPTADLVTYDPGHGPTAGAWFHGMNERGGKRWESRSQIEVADRPSTFAFVVGGVHDGIVRWCWRFAPHADGQTVVTLSWSLLRLDPVLGSSAAELLELQNFMQDSVHTTLVALGRHLRSNPRS